MKTISTLVAFLGALSFLVFVWLSHLGIFSSGTFSGHMLGGMGFAFLALMCVLILDSLSNRKDILAKNLLLVYSWLMILNAIAYILLKSFNLIGPYPQITSQEGLEVLLGFVYLVFAALGAAYIHYHNYFSTVY